MSAWAGGGGRSSPAGLVPGLGLVGAIAAVAWAASVLARAAHQLAPDAVVLAILLGLVVRARRAPGPFLRPGVAFAERRVLEFAIVLLGVSTNLAWLVRAGPALAGSVVAATVLALVAGVFLGRWAGLGARHALLVASGNAICGNSAIAAVAAVLDAPPEEAASAVAFTALLSLGLVVLLPTVGGVLALSDVRYGTLAGLTVYSVPQVAAATLPVSAMAGEVGALVKLLRVLMLMPLLLVLAHLRGRATGAPGRAFVASAFPWYIQLFLAFAVVRTLGFIPAGVAASAQLASHVLTVGAMAALGLAVDVRRLRDAGRPTALAATGSLVTLLLIAAAVVGLVPSD